MAKRNSRHKRFYSKPENVKTIPRLNIKSGMIVEFMYKDKNGKPSKPLVFVMDTDEYVPRDKKVFHGINLNYIPPTEIEKLFTNITKRAKFEIDRETKFPKIDLYEEEDIGVRPFIIFKPFVKAKLLPRFDCWRSYKYTNVRSVKQIKYQFNSPALVDVYDEVDEKVKQPEVKKPKQAEKPKQPKKPKTETTKPKQSKKPKQAEKPKGTKKDEGLLGLPKIVEAKAKTIDDFLKDD